ncbi:hypothetical protein PWT90_09746 [Aphanocladium album]|nr:hypothetical protein PWT90_09746 [Aphanocladium album]
MSASASNIHNRTTIKKRPRPLRLTDAKRAQIFQHVLESPHLTQKAVAEKFQDGKELRMAAPPATPAKKIKPSTDSALDLPAPSFGQLGSPIHGFGQLQSPLSGVGQLQTPRTEFDPMPTAHSAFGLMPASHSGVLQPSPMPTGLDPCICHLIPDALWDEIAAYGSAYTKSYTGKHRLNEPMDLSGVPPAPAFFQPLRKEVAPADADGTEDEQEDPCATQMEPY